MEENQVSHQIRFICIGGSAGSLQAVLRMLQYIEPGFNIPLMLVMHRNNNYDSALDELLSFKTTLQVKEIEDKDPVLPGYIYVCPADYHVLIETTHHFSLDYSEKIHYSRPSIDVVFKSAAEIYGRDLLAVLLSGANADGTEGLRRVKDLGGKIVIQDPKDAEIAYMPEHALQRMKAKVLTANDIGSYINQLAH